MLSPMGLGGGVTKDFRAQLSSRPKVAFEVGYAGVVVVAVILVLAPVWARSGWPLNQGTTAPLLLVQIYAAHFRHLDFFPVWSSTDGIGLGSPILLYYHRLFYYVAGLIYAVAGGGLKPSVELTIAVFLVVGAYGMRRAIGMVTESKLLCVVGSIGFLFTNYVFTDWLDPRGDLGEFSALMLVPWLLYWCLNLVKWHRVSFSLIPVVVLLVNAHSAIALTSLFTLAVALVVFVVVVGLKGLRAVLWRLVVCFVATVLLLAPLLIAQLRFSGAYDPATKNEAALAIWNQFIGFGRYLVDAAYRWSARGQIPPISNLVQIDYAIWVPIAAALLVGVVHAAMRSSRIRRTDIRQSIAAQRVPVFLGVSLAVYLFLQLKVSDFVYRLLTPLQVINFPWRMLAFITPIGIILVAVIADGLMRRHPSRALWWPAAGVWLASLLLLSPVVPLEGEIPGYFPVSAFTAPKTIDYPTFQGYFSISGFPPGLLYPIFLPKVFASNGSEITGSAALVSQYVRLHKAQAGAESLSGADCKVVGPSDAPLETLELKFSISCSSPTRLALPVSYNDYSSVFVQEAKGRLRQIPYSRRRTDPRLIINVPSGPETVVVHLPTLWGTLF
jgi:hypothetical protein